jgi:hypothetical protein
MLGFVAACALALATVPEDPVDEVCLLTLRAGASRMSAHAQSAASLTSRHKEMRKWASDHASKKNALMMQMRSSTHQPESTTLTSETAAMDAFISQQSLSTDRCHSKILEARRTLDGVTAKVLQLSDEVEGQEAIIEANTLRIKDAIEVSVQAGITKETDLAQCDAEYTKNMADLEHHREELLELRQIANPSVRSKVAHDINYQELINQHVAGVGEAFDAEMAAQSASLLEVSASSCQGMVNYLNSKKSMNGTKYTALDCNATRNVLQEEFTKSWETITHILEEGEAEAARVKEECIDNVNMVYSASQADTSAEMRDATRNIQRAKDVNTAVTPLLNNARTESEVLSAHLEQLKANCQLDDDVTDHLTRVRELIMSLEECPGRNDFRLEVPDLTSTAS